MSLEYNQQRYSVQELLLEHQSKKIKNFGKGKITFLGVEGYDVYNISSEFTLNGIRYIAGRVEGRNTEVSKVCFFRHKSDFTYEKDPTREIPLYQDPCIYLHNKTLYVAGTKIYTDENGKINRYHTVFYCGKTLASLKEVGQAPFGMKDVRILIKDKIVHTFFRPQGGQFFGGKITYKPLKSVKDIFSTKMDTTHILQTLNIDRDWIGANELHDLGGNYIGVIAHIARFDEQGDRHYYPISFIFNYLTKQATKPKILCERADLLKGPAKRADLVDVIFTGGLKRIENNKAILYMGVSDCEAHYAIIDDPFNSEMQKIHSSKEGNLSFRNVTKIYPPNVLVVKNFNLEIADKEFVVFVGPSGCGKTTTLRMVAGLEEITDGEIYIGKTLINNIPPAKRNIAMVFQSYALYPHMSVYDNMAYSLKIKKLPKNEIKLKVEATAKILGLTQYLHRKPKELSGGQRQRVAVGRAIIREANVFLMDEPLSNLDAKLRVQMRAEIIKLHQDIQKTFIYVTHDQVEAMTMADRIVIMNEGIVMQIGSPKEVYENPNNYFVASFIGTPSMNFIEGYISELGELEIAGTKFESSMHFKETLNLKKKQLIEKHSNSTQLLNQYRKTLEDLEVLENVIKVQEPSLLKDKALEEFYAKTRDMIIEPKVFLTNESFFNNKTPQVVKNHYLRSIASEKNKLQVLIDSLRKDIDSLMEYQNGYYNKKIIFGIRPIEITLNNTKVVNSIKTKIEIIELLGDECNVIFSINEVQFISKQKNTQSFKANDVVYVSFNFSKSYIFDQNTGERIV